MRKSLLLLPLLMLFACSEMGDSKPTLQLVRPGVPTGTFTLRNNTDFTVGVVTLLQCETNAVAQPAPQQIPSGESATYEVSAGCYRIVSGEAGLSFRYLTDTTVRIEPNKNITLP